MRSIYAMLFLIVFSAAAACTSGEVNDAEVLTQVVAATTTTTRAVPADGKVRVLVGQDSDTLTQYKSAILDGGFGAPSAGGVTLYTNLMSDPGYHLAGIPAPYGIGARNWGAGNVDYALTMMQYPAASLAVGLDLSSGNNGCNNKPLRALLGMQNGSDVTQATVDTYRANLDKLVNYLKSLNRDVYLRIGYEFDGSWNCYNRDWFKQTFRYVKDRINALGASRVATVWQSAAYPVDGAPANPEWGQNFCSQAAHLDDWYPGDNYVDFVGLSHFYGANYATHQWSCRTTTCTPRSLQERLVTFARDHDKLVMIAEAAPQGYATGAQTAACLFDNGTNAPVGLVAKSAASIWTEWYEDMFNWIETNTDVIRVVAYINAHWQAQPMWDCPNAGGTRCDSGYWGDSRIQAHDTIRTNFINRIKTVPYEQAPGVPDERAPEPGVTYALSNVNSGMCATIEGASTSNGAAARQSNCNGTANQRIRLVEVGAGQYKVEFEHSAKVLDVSGVSSSDGARLHQWAYVGGNNQKVNLVPQEGGSYSLKFIHSGKCADVVNASTAPDTRLVQVTCNNSASQRWRFVL